MSYKKYRHELNGKIMILETTLELLESDDLSVGEYRRLLECFKKAIVDLKSLSQEMKEGK